MADLLYTIKANTPKEEIIKQLRDHPEIKFVSLLGIDLAGNDTDEKIPVRVFIKDMDAPCKLTAPALFCPVSPQ